MRKSKCRKCHIKILIHLSSLTHAFNYPNNNCRKEEWMSATRLSRYLRSMEKFLSFSNPHVKYDNGHGEEEIDYRRSGFTSTVLVLTSSKSTQNYTLDPLVRLANAATS